MVAGGVPGSRSPRRRWRRSPPAVVLGGGPIGLLVAMVAKEVGAQVIISEVNPTRIAIAI